MNLSRSQGIVFMLIALSLTFTSVLTKSDRSEVDGRKSAYTKPDDHVNDEHYMYIYDIVPESKKIESQTDKVLQRPTSPGITDISPFNTSRQRNSGPLVGADLDPFNLVPPAVHPRIPETTEDIPPVIPPVELPNQDKTLKNPLAVNGPPICNGYFSPIPGSIIRETDKVNIQCQCASATKVIQLCPNWKFITGEEYVTLEEQVIDSSPESYCSISYKFRLKHNLQEGFKTIALKCYLPGVTEDVSSYEVFFDSPTSVTPSHSSHLNIYLIMAIVVFLFLLCSIFGCIFHCQFRNRRRNQRRATFRNPFIQPERNHHMIYSAPLNCGYETDNPPSYNEATSLPQNIDGSCSFNFVNSCPMRGSIFQERLVKLANTSEGKRDDKQEAFLPSQEQPTTRIPGAVQKP